MRRLSSRNGSEFAGIQARAKRLSKISENVSENDNNNNNEFGGYNYGSIFEDDGLGPLPPIGSVMHTRSSPPSYIYIYYYYL